MFETIKISKSKGVLGGSWSDSDDDEEEKTKNEKCLMAKDFQSYPTLDNGIYDIVDRVMRPLALKQTRRPRSDRGKARHSVSSSSSHHYGTSSHQHDDDDVETSRASTPSPTTYLNSLDPLNYQNYEMPSASEQTDETLFERQTTLLNQIKKYT
ncbi:hypothetical protein Tco_0837026 [Tanacetum coccineum]